MKKTLSLALAALGFAAIVAPTAAFATEGAAIATTTTENITWVDASVPSGDHSQVTIKIFSVTKRSSGLWQRCNFSFTGTGSYLCGIDSAAGSLAQEQGGRWVAKAFLDGVLVARQGFSL